MGYPSHYFRSKKEVKIALDSIDITPAKYRGQNFLCSFPALSQIMESCQLESNDVVLEIGPGLGALTFPMAALVKLVRCIEIEPAFVEYIEQRASELHLRNVQVERGDALEVPVPRGITKIVSSMPYSIAGLLVSRIAGLVYTLSIPAFIICQKEFSHKLQALPGSMEYSRISANVRYHARAREIMDLSRNNFYPVPRVDSVLVELTPASKREIEYALYEKMTRILFPFKNKTLRRALIIIGKNSQMKDRIKASLNQLDILKVNPRVRDLNMRDFTEIANVFSSIGLFRD